MASSLPSDVSEAAVCKDETYSILDLASLLCIAGSVGFVWSIPVCYPVRFFSVHRALQDVF